MAAKRMLANPDLINELKQFDLDQVTTEQIKQLEPYVTSDEFEINKVRNVSMVRKLCHLAFLTISYTIHY